MEKSKTFQVKEVCEICKVTRKALLIYEEKGILTPSRVNEETGYRYYSAENVSKIMLIRKFQSFGFSLDEIREYLTDTKELSEVLDRLTHLKEELEETIGQLKMRMMTEEYDKQEVLTIRLPRSVSYARRAATKGYEEALCVLRDTHLAAIKTGFADKAPRMYTVLLSCEKEYPDIYAPCEMLYCIPMNDDYTGEYAVVEEETRALSLFHRGGYADLTHSVKKLLDYCTAKGFQPNGPLRFIWLEGPPVHSTHEERYLTQLALPIKG